MPRAASTLSAAGLGALLAVVLAVPSPALAEGADGPVLLPSSDSITAGDRVTLSGAAAPGAAVSLYGYSSPSTTYALQREGTASDDGTFAFVLAPGTNSRYYAVADGAGAGPSVVLPVRYAVRLDPVVVEGDALTVSGRLLPRSANPVQVVFTRDDVSTVEATARPDLRGAFRVTFTSDRRGAFAVSAAVPAGRDNAAGESAAQQVVVRPGQTVAHTAG